MPRKRHSSEEIIHKLREAGIALAKGSTTGEVARQLGVTEQTYYRWRKECASMNIQSGQAGGGPSVGSGASGAGGSGGPGAPGGEGSGAASAPDDGATTGAGSLEDLPLDDGELTPVAEGALEKEAVKGTAQAKHAESMKALEGAEAKLGQKLEFEEDLLNKLDQDVKYGANNPNLTSAEREAMFARLNDQKARVSQVEEDLFLTQGMLKHGNNVNDAIGTSVGGIFALDALVQSEAKTKALVSQGKYQEAYENSLSEASKYVVDSILSVPNKLSGGTGIALSMAASEFAAEAGRNAAQLTFNPMVNASHWLYQQSWWPKNRVPRVTKP